MDDDGAGFVPVRSVPETATELGFEVGVAPPFQVFLGALTEDGGVAPQCLDEVVNLPVEGGRHGAGVLGEQLTVMDNEVPCRFAERVHLGGFGLESPTEVVDGDVEPRGDGGGVTAHRFPLGRLSGLGEEVADRFGDGELRDGVEVAFFVDGGLAVVEAGGDPLFVDTNDGDERTA